MKKTIMLVVCAVSLLCLLTSCNSVEKSSNLTESTDVSTNEPITASYKQQLSDFNSLVPDDIREIDIVYVYPEEGTKYVYKTFTTKSDIQNILLIVKNSNINETEPMDVANGWNLLVRIWPSKEKTDVDSPILITPYGSNYITIGNYVYSVENKIYYEDLIQYFQLSALEEKAYIE